MPKIEPDPDYPGKTGNICNACHCPIALDGSCFCNNPEWNHKTQQKINPNERTQIIDLPDDFGKINE